MFHAVPTGLFLHQSLGILMGLCLLHLVFVTVAGRLPRVVAAAFVVVFGVFLWLGFA